MISKSEGNLVLAKLDAGEDLFDSLLLLKKKYGIKSGYVVFGIGALKNFELGYFNKKTGQYAKATYRQAHELLALHGSIAEAEQSFHLHAALGDSKHKVIGGHLFAGVADPLVELLVLKTRTKMIRKENKATGLNELFFD
ncbi:MAG: PPC domain-containing DNA-binding protein [Candidatus Micrarchaeia archaeon]